MKMTPRRAFSFAALMSASVLTTLSLAGCVSSGTEVKQDQASQFKPGVSKESDVVAALGAPNITSTQPDGSKTETYTHFSNTMKASSFIPIVGLFSSGSTMKQSSVTFTFDSSGVLKNVSSHEMNNDVNTGLLGH